MFFLANKNQWSASGRHLADLTTIGKPSTSISGFGILYPAFRKRDPWPKPLVLNSPFSCNLNGF